MYTIVDVNAANLAFHPQAICFINPKHPTYQFKVDWLSERFREGLRIKLAYAEGEKRPAGFIEYVPGENCWRAVSAPGTLFIHCIWVNAVKHKNKGLGAMLLNECVTDAKHNGITGVAAMTSSGSFMADQTLFEKNGFQLADKAVPHHQLMFKPLNPGPVPVFNNWQSALRKYKGLHIIYSRQCPWVARFVSETGSALLQQGVEVTITEIKTPDQAQAAPSPYAVFNLVHNGTLLAAHYISGTRLNNILTSCKITR